MQVLSNASAFFRMVGGEDMSVRFACTAAHIAEHAVRLVCRVLGASRSWSHAWWRASPTRAQRAPGGRCAWSAGPAPPATWRGSRSNSSSKRAQIAGVVLSMVDSRKHASFGFADSAYSCGPVKRYYSST